MRKVKANVTALPVTTGTTSTLQTSATKSTEELLLCRLCSVKYHVNGRRPLTLRCAHTFCELCLHQLLRSQMDDSKSTMSKMRGRINQRHQLVCPTCTMVTPLDNGCTPSSLPVNHSIMELLEIFDSPSPDGLPARSTEVAAGYSQVRVNAPMSQCSPVNGSVNTEPHSKLVKVKKNRLHGFDPATSVSADEPVGGATNHVNWVSTVNIGRASPQPPQQQQQQQQNGSSSFTAAKMTSAPSATVTSVSTSKKHPRQSSSASSSSAVSSSLTNAGPTATAPTHNCCRCGQRPAAVSVASSSHTIVPQKLCNDCWNQPTRRKNDEDERRGASSSGTEQTGKTITEAKQPESGSVGAARVSTAKVESRSGVGTSATLRKNEPENTAAKADSAPVVTASLDRNRQAASIVAHGKSTIEVRRRSQYVDSSSRASASTTQNSSSQSSMTDNATTGNTVDQSVQSTTGQASSVSTGPRHTSATNAQQRSTTNRFDTQPTAVPESIPEVLPVGSGTNAGTDRNSGNRARQVEPTELDDATGCSSAPSITDIHPMPCSNPPYNPDFEEDSSLVWSSAQHHWRISDTSPETRDQEQIQRKQPPPDLSATTGTGLSLSLRMAAGARHRYPTEQPPKYEDIIRDDDVVTASAPAATNQVHTSPTDPVAATTRVAMKLVRSFGKYGEISTQPGAFRAPGHVSVSSATETSTRVVVGDGANGTVQVFGETGECLSMLRAETVRGCCLLVDNLRLLLATDRGVEVSQFRIHYSEYNL